MIREGIPLTEVRDQADHSSLEVTNVYTKFARTGISKDIKEKCEEF